MKLHDGTLRLSPTDLANFLVCRHKTALDVRAAAGVLRAPTSTDPLADALRRLGTEHETRHVEALRGRGLSITDVSAGETEERREAALAAMRAGADVIIQAPLVSEEWFGYADILRRVETPSPAFGGWSYEVHDTKLARETRGGTILQLCVYTEMLSSIQGVTPEYFHVVTPVGTEPYRTEEFAAFYRQISGHAKRFAQAEVPAASPATFPEPVDHCGVCRWSQRCQQQRRSVDHLSLVAGLARRHQAELTSQGIATLAGLAATPVPWPFAPSRGARETYEQLREQARVQLEQRTTGRPVHELLPLQADAGLARLPEPRPGDLFLDLEGDPFGRRSTSGAPGETGREYLFGVGRVGADGRFDYTARWAFTDAEELTAFDAVMTDIMTVLDADPAAHVYHYAPYEPSAFKRLMGRYASREADVDRLLRGERFVDLYAVVRRALRAGCEKYSIKNLEPLYEFTRDVDLTDAGDQRRVVEAALEMGDAQRLSSEVRATVEGYNKDDCRSTLALRNWLESERTRAIADGATIVRPEPKPDKPTDDLDERARNVAALRERLLAGVPAESEERSVDERARYQLAYLLDWHRREDKAGWWEYFRLCKLAEDELFEESRAVAGLAFVCEVGKIAKSVVHRYHYPEQEFEIRRGDTLKTQDGKVFTADIHAIDRTARTLDLKVGPSRKDLRPTALFAHDHVNSRVIEDALFTLGQQVADAGAVHGLPLSPARALLLRVPPALASTGFVPPLQSVDEAIADYAVDIVNDLAQTTLAIQGPPGSGKTYTGARMIHALVLAGKKVGVVGPSHKVIRNLLDAVAAQGAGDGGSVRLAHKNGDEGVDEDDEAGGVVSVADNAAALAWLQSGKINVLGGTAWLWARPEFASAVDVLFVDEAGQMSLANVLGVSRAAKSLVLLGDPQQLEQPSKGTHPDEVGLSALEHILGDADTMPAELGLFLPLTWRLAPTVCRFTSEVFYAGRLASKSGLERQRLNGNGRFEGSGLWYVAVDHRGNRNASDEEAEEVARLVEGLLAPDSMWVNGTGDACRLTANDICVVAPFNAHVQRIQERLAARGAIADAPRVGTVDKFQGQEAAVVIYSMATSHPDDAPRGMEFLYSLNRLNVATSRARCAVMLVASPRLFEPDCHTPRQMRLVNALCRYREMAGAMGSYVAPST